MGKGCLNNACEACSAGKYRDNVATQSSCQPCTECPAGYKRIAACGPIYNTNVAVECQQCGTGTYLSGGSCVACNTCQIGYGVVQDCTSTTQRTCLACSTGYTTSAINKLCTYCADGYFPPSGYASGATSFCAPCAGPNRVAAAECFGGQWVNCAGGTRLCPYCDGQDYAGSTQCQEHWGVSTACDGKSNVQVSCQICGPGTERPLATPKIGTPPIQACVQCPTGKYKLATVTTAVGCTDCGNKPGNSAYTTWAIGGATTTACPWACNAGYYRASDACQICPVGTYKAGVGNEACGACTNAPANAYYLQRGVDVLTTGNACPWDCGAGYVRNGAGTACVACGSGTYREASQNRLAEAATSNACYACAVCLSGTYQSRACAAARDTGCTSCSTACPVGRYIARACGSTSDIGCDLCTRNCSAGYRLTLLTCSGQSSVDEVLLACKACKVLGDCPAGYYLDRLCAGTETVDNQCVPCNTNKACTSDQYKGGCSGLVDTTCLPFTVCPTGQYLEDESSTRDGYCMPCSTCVDTTVMRACSKYQDTVCRGKSCSAGYPCNPRLTASNRSAYFCNYDQSFCGVCPYGYGSDGMYCLECPRGSTCDRIGQVACRGQCGAGVTSRCETLNDLGYAVCDTACVLPSPQNRIAWRGSAVRAGSGDCATYFQCSVGYYKSFATGGSVACLPCAERRPSQGLTDRWVTEGLSVGDPSSCLWECRRELARWDGSAATCVARAGGSNLAATNIAGWWAGGACGLGKTSEALSAVGQEECLACMPLVADRMQWVAGSVECAWTCLLSNDLKLGGACVPRRRDCAQEGLVVGADGSCVSTSYPWNLAGFVKTGWGVPVKGLGVQEAGGSDGVVLTTGMGGFQYRHNVTVPALGNLRRRVEGQMCSGVRANMGGYWYVFGALCNQSFLVYVNLSAPDGQGLGVLIGSNSRGWRDGFRTQALFESELYVASGAGLGGSLFVLDTWNCLVREVVVWDRPGSYLTRVYTLWGNQEKLGLVPPQPKCYGTDALAWPRRFWVLRDGWLAFTDENGVWQLHVGTRELLAMIGESVGGFEADGLVGLDVTDRFTLRLYFAGGVMWSVPALQEACPPDTTSLAGGDCVVACQRLDSAGRAVRYVDAGTGACRPCSVLDCGPGYVFVACSGRADGYCQACPSVAGMVYTLAGSCAGSTMRLAAPCRAGWYAGVGGIFCEACPPYTTTQYGLATRAEQCKCLAGLVRKGGQCVAEDLFRFEDACVLDGACSVPANARVTTGYACAWECNAGYYRDSLAGFASQCRPCLVGSGRTRGDDDSPWSCE